MGNRLVTGDPRVRTQERVEARPRVLERGWVGERVRRKRVRNLETN